MVQAVQVVPVVQNVQVVEAVQYDDKNLCSKFQVQGSILRLLRLGLPLNDFGRTELFSFHPTTPQICD